MTMSTQTDVTTDTVRITRTFRAPRKDVWHAWTNEEHFKKWWGPHDYTCPSAKLDVRLGGTYLAAMRSKEGKTTWGTGTYRDIVPFERLVFTDSFSDEDGNIISAKEAGMSVDMARELLVTITFMERDGETIMALAHAPFPPEIIDDCTQGWNESFDKLAASLG
jgi:uncharacterized protein YndB with AHSA1/START domain